MSYKVQQSVCSDCVTYVKSRIKFNTFNTFNNVKPYNYENIDIYIITFLYANIAVLVSIIINAMGDTYRIVLFSSPISSF